MVQNNIVGLILQIQGWSKSLKETLAMQLANREKTLLENYRLIRLSSLKT